METRKPKIFISYVRDDLNTAEELYNEFSKLGFEPWMDIHNMQGGEDWKIAIKQAISKSDFFIACLSTHSVDKRGVFQEEIKEALDFWRQKKEDDIFIIPVRFEECEVPYSLQSLHWVNLFDKGGKAKIISSIREGMRRLGIVLHKEWEPVDNTRLIEDNLRHISFELERGEPNYFRIAKESHQALFRAMIETLRGTANLDLIQNKDPKKSVRFQHGNDPWMEIHKIGIPGCKLAWRFSQPAPCDEPTFSKEQKIEDIIDQPSDSALISFWDALAMIQTTPFMRRYVHSKPVYVSDSEIKTLEWLDIDIRKEFDEFMPKLYSAPVPDLIRASAICIKIIRELLFDSGLVLKAFWPEELEKLIFSVETKLRPLEGKSLA